jgi:hypothetical protein
VKEMVAEDGIEPPTRGFSKRSGALKIHDFHRNLLKFMNMLQRQNNANTTSDNQS